MVVVLIGMKHCGKSTLGTALAKRWQAPFYDVDSLMEEHQACESGRWLTVREIYNELGEARFDELETQVVCELYLRLNGTNNPTVVAVGGRTALNARVAELLGGIGVVVYLRVSPEEMFQRILFNGLPSFIDQNDPVMSFLELYAERVPHYERLAQITVNLDGLAPDAALDALTRHLNDYALRRHDPTDGPSPRV